MTIEQLKTSFDKCVREGHSMCTFQQGSSIVNATFVDYASQMAWFCGHDPFCDEWEGEELYQKAVQVTGQ